MRSLKEYEDVSWFSKQRWCHRRGMANVAMTTKGLYHSRSHNLIAVWARGWQW